MHRIWVITLFSVILLMAGCSPKETGTTTETDQSASNNPDITRINGSDTLAANVKEVDSLKNGQGEQTLPEENATKNIPDIEESPEKPDKPVEKKRGPRISFNQMNYDWGEIEQGEKVTKAFTFTNTGDTPLNILNATATCGCTMPSYPFLPVDPGGTGKIEVTYDSRLKYGQQEAKITVQTDAYPKTYELMMTGYVKEKPEKDSKEEPKDSTSSEGR